MMRGLAYGALFGLAVGVGAYASAVWDWTLGVYFFVLGAPGAFLGDLVSPPPTNPFSPHWHIIGNIVCYGLLGPLIPRLARGRLPKPGHCTRCAYNLTGNASGICPECGTGVRK